MQWRSKPVRNAEVKGSTHAPSCSVNDYSRRCRRLLEPMESTEEPDSLGKLDWAGDLHVIDAVATVVTIFDPFDEDDEVLSFSESNRLRD